MIEHTLYAIQKHAFAILNKPYQLRESTSIFTGVRARTEGREVKQTERISSFQPY